MNRALPLICFFLSGSTGLMYEVLWTRIFGQTIGNTHFSITVVVSVFMGGLALGSAVGGRLADRSPNPLRLYGALTLLVGVACVLVPLAVLAARPLFAWLYSFHEGEPEAPLLLGFRILFSAAVLLVPTSFMGATLPALSRHFARRLGDVGKTVGLLYALNTLGAAAGALFTGFLGVRLLGTWGVTALAVLIDLAIGLAVLAVSRRAPAPAAPRELPLPSGAVTAPPAEPMDRERMRLPREARIALAAFAAAGFANMLLQIAWTKAIVLSIGNSTYAFSLIVTLFILGIATGGGIMAAFADRIRNLLLASGTLLVITAALVSATIPLLGDFPVLAARMFDSIDEPSYPRFLRVQLLLVSVVILPSTVLMGTLFPLVSKLRARAVERVGTAVGSAYSWNTVGSILGTLAAGFLFIPLFGRVHYTLYLGAAISLLTGAVLLHQSLPSRMGSAARAAVAAASAAIVVAPHLLFFLPHGVFGSTRHYWHEGLMSRGAYAYYQGTYRDPSGKVLPRRKVIDGLIAENQVIRYEEGIHAPVAVVRNSQGTIALRISGKVEASLAPGGAFNTDFPHQVLAGHLPMILCARPRTVLTLGLGGGVTLGTLTLYAAEQIDSLEISPEVIELAKDHFGAANRGALMNPRVRSVIGDGRNHIEYTTRRYDVITSVPSNPWIAGIGSLFTLEFFQACRDRLEPGGIVCSWIHKINMREEDFATVVRTFIAVFGDSSQLWDLGYDCLLLGRAGPPIRLDSARFASLLENPEIAKDLSVLGIVSPETLCRHFLFDAEGMRRYARTAQPLNTDAYPVLEFSAPYGLYGHYLEAFSSLAGAEVVEVPEEVLEGASVPPGDRARRLQRAFHAAQRVEARHGFLTSLQQDLAEGVEAARPALRTLVLECVADLTQIERSSKDADPWLRSHANGVASRVLGVPQGENLAATVFSALMPLVQHSPQVDRDRLMAEAGTIAPDTPATAALYAKLCLGLKLPGKARPVLEEALIEFPDDPRLIQVLGIVEAELSRHDRALELFGKALALAKEPALRSEIHANLAYLHQSAKRWEEALRECEYALREDPKNSAAIARRDEIRKAAAAASP